MKKADPWEYKYKNWKNQKSNFKKEKEGTLVIATHGNIPEKFADSIYTIENGRIN